MTEQGTGNAFGGCRDSNNGYPSTPFDIATSTSLGTSQGKSLRVVWSVRLAWLLLQAQSL